MKINELLESKQIIFEAVSFRGIQNVVYEYVLTNMKLEKSLQDHARELTHSTDQFWVDEFDSVLGAFERSKDIYVIEDALSDAVIAVSESIVDYYGDSANHPPGYKAKKLTPLSNVKEKDLHAMIEKIDANYMKKLKDEEAAEKLHQKAIKAEQIKSITPERLQKIAAFVKKNDAAGWKVFYKQIKNPKIKLSDYFDFKDIPESKAQAVKSPEELKALFKSLEPKKYIAGIVDNFWNTAELSKEEEFHGLRIVASNNALCVKLAKLI